MGNDDFENNRIEVMTMRRCSLDLEEMLGSRGGKKKKEDVTFDIKVKGRNDLNGKEPIRLKDIGIDTLEEIVKKYKR